MPAGRTCLQSLRSIEDEPSEKVMIELRRRHFPDPWGRSSLGEQEALETIDLAEIRGFFQRQFQPQGTILGVAGHIEWEPLKDLVGKLFGDWQPADGAAIDEIPAEGGYLHVPYDSAQTHIGIAYPSVPYRHSDYFQAWGAVGALGGGMSSRLFTEVRERRGLCYSVYASYHTLRDRAGVFCYAGSSAQRAQETLDVTLGELRRLAARHRTQRVATAQGPHQDRPDHAAGIELLPQFVDRPRMVPYQPGPHARRNWSRSSTA